LASLSFPCPAFCERQDDKPATSTGWQQLGLAKTTIAGTTVLYDKSLEPNLPVFETHYKKFLAERQQGQQTAEESLKAAPDNIPAMTLQMLVNLEDERLSVAKELAKKIISLSKNEQSRPHKLALKVLAIDPNQLPPQR